MDEENDYQEPGPAYRRRRGQGRPRAQNRAEQNAPVEGDWRYPRNRDHNPRNPREYQRQEDRPRPNPNYRYNNLQGDQLRGNNRRENRNEEADGNDRHQNRVRLMGFRALEEIAQSDEQEILIKINERKDSFLILINSTIDRNDMFVLIIKILSKVSQSSFDQLKLKLLLDICNSQFIGHLRNYLMDLPYAEVKARNNLYWNNQREFWNNFVAFCECIIDLSPGTALRKCRSLIEDTSKCCLEGLKSRHGFDLPDENVSKLTELRQRLSICEKENVTLRPKKFHLETDDMEPPDDFRLLNVVPSYDDLLEVRPFVRPNIVQGAYRDVEHYLDVQFRLLREDCFGPLRDGILQFMQDPNRHKFDNIRIFRNVKFIEPYISKTKIGVTVQLDEKTIKKFKKVNWAHSKRFIFGSLLLFTKDNCKTIITATILERDTKLLANGKIPVSIMDTEMIDELYTDALYMMIESEVYFEPYLHVLKALQDPKFPEHIAMAKYIVSVDPVSHPPNYLNPDSEYNVETQYFKKKNFGKIRFQVLGDAWPTKEDLGFNDTQHEAYKLALTHEFAVIQGPPGTGKTFLGVKVANTLLQNLDAENEEGKCLMLVICYTNHALDQFLEALLPITNSIVRIGGQSRNEAMENINLTTLRRKTKLSHITNKMFYEQLNNLRYTVNELKRAQEVIDELNNGLISYDIIKEIVPESLFLREYYNNYRNDVKSDPLKHWLFENMNYVDFNTELLNEYPQPDNDLNNIDEDDVHERVDFILDDFSEEVDQNDYHRTMLLDHEIKSSFSIKEAQNKLINLLLLYNRTNNRQHQLKLQQEIVNTKSCIDLYVEMAANYNRDFPLVLDNRTNLMRVRPVDRWSFYFKWAKIVIDVLKKNMKPLQESLQSANYAYEEARMMVDLKLLKGVKVVGMTTSGAARLRKLLQALAPPIVIVEEAAEVLEQHIVTSLTKDCKHLVLIGDHQQLRPSASHMKLARHFNIEISLFERMITNGMHSQRLGVQHRMRPEIAALISPHIYPDLQNHPSVHHFPRVRGMSDNLFFLTHNYKEENVEDSSSRSNLLEADMTLGLANYLMQQGYESEDVTILSAYSGQMFYMRKQREKYAHLSKVKITVVDNYQGEESKIILLSLVRNNDQNKIGFLGTENRVCVALSRAREGFYIFGNIDILKKNSTLWTNIAATLETNNSIGTSIFLKCENHPDLISTISSPKDFEKVPEGGCLLKCNFNLPCGHKCPRACHGYDRSHVDTKCYLKCERFLCDLLHVCPLLCWVKCQPCMRLVEKSLPCGHKMLVHCHKDPKDPTVLCTTTVSVTLPLCGHEAKKPCYKKIETVQCAVRCIYRVDKCGHECMLNCHLNDDPDHEKYKCEKPCAKAKKGCSQAESLAGDRLDHQCPKRCYEDCDNCTVEVMKKRSACKHTERVACNLDVDKTLCRKNCARVLNCGHFCKLKCYQKCGECKQKVKKVIPDCNHNVEVMCMQEATRQLCKQPCEKLLPCGHRCMDRCNRPCDPDKCTVMITEKQFDSPCGHKVTLPCNVYNAMIKNEVEPERLLQYCSKRCTVELKCGHMCGGTCATCHQGRLHAACTQTCHQINICGHQCQEPCNQVCPPCKIPCEIKCPHSRCNKLCGEQCKPCQEKCARVCRHGACKNLCGEPCSRPPCDEPCAKRLRCGHACRGLCGEPCPRICKVCRPDDFPTTFLGDDYDDDERFVQLQDCPHVLDVENMDNLMTGDTESITIRACPFCRKPIINTYRYKDLVNKMFTTKINPIKWKVYGQEKEIRERKEELSLKVIKLNDTYGRVKEENSYWKLAYLKLSTKVKTQKKNVSLLKLEMQFQYLNILEMIAEYYEKYTVANLTLLKREFFDLVKVLCRLLNVSAEKISQQQQEDIGNELKRMNAIIQFSKILSHSAYLSTKAVPKVATATDMAKQAVLSWHKFDDKEARTALMRLQEEVKVSGVVTREERELVVRAVGLKAGHWYKCPQGHFYCIGECGGAMEVARCPECGSRIGGSGHRLLADNAHAPEMDGSRFAAWSEEFNNMANFNFE